MARIRARDLRAEAIPLELTWSPSDDVEVTFDIDAPTLRHALQMRWLPSFHLTGPNIADMLGVSLASLHDALQPLVDIVLIDINGKDTVTETWNLQQAAPTLADLLLAADRRGIALDTVLDVVGA